jgi:LEA14-like dessication related protein
MKAIPVKLFLKNSIYVTFCLLILLLSCAPKEPVVFRGIKNISVDLGANGKPVLKADIFLFNPNKMKIKLKEANVEVFVDGTKSAEVKHPLNVLVPAKSDFSVPIVAQLALKESGFLDTVVGLLGGKKYEVVFTGYIRIGVHGITIKVPVSQKQELKLNL